LSRALKIDFAIMLLYNRDCLKGAKEGQGRERKKEDRKNIKLSVISFKNLLYER
jgi:hypothetical protein